MIKLKTEIILKFEELEKKVEKLACNQCDAIYNYKCPECNGEFNQPAYDCTEEGTSLVGFNKNYRCPFCGRIMEGM